MNRREGLVTPGDTQYREPFVGREPIYAHPATCKCGGHRSLGRCALGLGLGCVRRSLVLCSCAGWQSRPRALGRFGSSAECGCTQQSTLTCPTRILTCGPHASRHCETRVGVTDLGHAHTGTRRRKATSPRLQTHRHAWSGSQPRGQPIAYSVQELKTAIHTCLAPGDMTSSRSRSTPDAHDPKA